ncbi:hypothetical protein WJX77_009062 [Trebouxia sp. C0004]
MVANLLVTKNLALNKVAHVLAYLNIEIASHRDQMVEEFFPLLLTFGEAPNNNDRAGSTEMAFAAILTDLQAAATLLHQLTLLVVNLLSQLGALCSEQTRKSTVISGPYALSCMSSAADGLGLIFKLDTIIGRTPAVTSAAAAYSKMLHVIASNQEQFGSERTQQAQQQQPWVADLQAGLLSGKSFCRFLSQHCGMNSSMTQICCHQAFAQAVSGTIREQTHSAVERIQSKIEVAGDGESLVGLVCLAAVHAHVCSQLGVDKKLTKSMLDLHHKIPLLPVYCNLSIHPASFLSQMLPSAADKYIHASFVREALAEQRVQVDNGMSNFGLEVQQASLTVLAWQAQMAALHATTRSSEALLTKQAAALVRGVDLAAGLRNRLHLLLDLHAAASVPVTQQALALFVSSMCLVKGVSKTFEEHDAAITPALPHLVNHIRSGAQGLLSAMAAKVRAKQRHLASTAPSLLQFTSTRTAADKALKDAETATEAALQVIAGPATSEQLVMLDLCVDALKATATISSNRMQSLDSALHTLRALIRLRAAVSQASDCSWLYFDQGLLEPIFGAALKRPQDAHHLPYILAAFMDAQQLLQHMPLPPDRADAAPKTQAYDDQLWLTLEQVVLLPLSQRIETDLRLHHHAALLTGVPPMNPLTHDIMDVNPLLEVDKLVLSTRVVDIRSYIAQRLTASFCSHTAVSPHDWQTYEEMRILALDKHHLRLGAIDLPTQAPDQRVDVQAVIHDLPAFVSSFDYSLVSQTFLQQPAAAGRTAHLDTLSIQHTAEALQAGLQQQQLAEAQQSCLDCVAGLLTGIGNALGLLRSLHHGAQQYQWDLAQYSESISEPKIGSGKQFQRHGDTGEAILDVLAHAQDADVQKSLPAAFLQVAAAATLSAADHGVQGKEQATRRSRTLPDDAQMFADGFVVGLSFALQALGQQEQFGNLQWWRALLKYHDQQEQNLRGCAGSKTQVSSTEAVSGTWLQGFFKLRKDANARQHVDTDMLSEVDMGRMQLQLQHLERMQQEIKLIQRTFVAVPSVWTRI